MTWRSWPGWRHLAALGLASLLLFGSYAYWSLSTPAQPRIDPAGRLRDARLAEVDRHFRQGVAMLHMGRHNYAMVAFRRVVELSPGLPEAHVNLGYALVGLKHYPEARDSFLRAIDLKPEQANAYYGLGIAHEKSGDLASALGAMRTYVHLTPESVPQVRKAKAAIWEWENLRQAQGRQVSR